MAGLEQVGVLGRRAGWLAGFLVALIGSLLILLGATAFAAEPPPTGQATVIRLQESSVDPAEVTVSPGGSVVWVNQAGANRTVTADDGSFDSGVIGAEQTFQFVFASVRTVTYHVTGGATPAIGTVSVVAPPAPTAPAANPSGPFGDSGATRPTDLASTGSTDWPNVVTGVLLALGGAGLVVWGRRGAISVAWLGSPLARYDDHLPRGPRRPGRPARRGRAPRRSPFRV